MDQLVEIIKVLGTPSKEQIRQMNSNYTEFKFPQIKAHPWNKVDDALGRARQQGPGIGVDERLLNHCSTSVRLLPRIHFRDESRCTLNKAYPRSLLNFQSPLPSHSSPSPLYLPPPPPPPPPGVQTTNTPGGN